MILSTKLRGIPLILKIVKFRCFRSPIIFSRNGSMAPYKPYTIKSLGVKTASIGVNPSHSQLTLHNQLCFLHRFYTLCHPCCSAWITPHSSSFYIPSHTHKSHTPRTHRHIRLARPLWLRIPPSLPNQSWHWVPNRFGCMD